MAQTLIVITDEDFISDQIVILPIVVTEEECMEQQIVILPIVVTEEECDVVVL